jgi:hypothetical protein
MILKKIFSGVIVVEPICPPASKWDVRNLMFSATILCIE